MSKRTKITNVYSKYNRVRLIRGGQEYFHEILRLIGLAKKTIHLQSYIFKDDETGRLVIDALKQAASRGVMVYVVADGFASQELPSRFIEDIREAGIHFRYFAPFFKNRYFYFGRRMHHKVFVSDARYALVGGVNIADRYNDLPSSPAWLDFALMVEGEVSLQLCDLCLRAWRNKVTGAPETSCGATRDDYTLPANELSEVRMRRNDWVRNKNEISATYVEMLRNAHSQVTILCSYFLPGKVIRAQMTLARKRGVAIRVIAAGPSDLMLAKFAERWLYDWLLRQGVQLFEYQRNILHGKLAVCDDSWMTLGSYNVNNISAYASIELNLDVKNPDFAREVRMTLDEIISRDCKEIRGSGRITPKNIFRKFLQWLSYQFIRMVIFLFTFYYRRRS